MALKIWICSFIPQDIAGYTVPMPNGGKKTMIPGPLSGVSDCFLTDQRSFSNSSSASSRTRSSVEIDPAAWTLLSQNHHCDNTIEVDCEDGQEECSKKPDASKLKISGFASSGQKCSFAFEGGAGNPCAGPLAPDIDWLVRVSVERQNGTITVRLDAGSFVEPFPAFEMSASWNGVTKAVFQRSPDPQATPWNLPGPPNKPVAGTVTLP